MLTKAPRGMLSFAVPMESSASWVFQQSWQTLYCAHKMTAKEACDVIRCDVFLIERIIKRRLEPLHPRDVEHIVPHPRGDEFINNLSPLILGAANPTVGTPATSTDAHLLPALFFSSSVCSAPSSSSSSALPNSTAPKTKPGLIVVFLFLRQG